MTKEISNLGGIVDASIDGGYLAITGARELMTQSVDNIKVKTKLDGKAYGVKDDNPNTNKKLSAKAKLFTSHVIGGLSTKEAYRIAYDCQNASEATVCVNANKLLNDSRISKLIGNYLNQSTIEILADQQTTRRHILQELLKHSQDEKAQLNNRLRSLELMGKAIGMFTDKVEAIPQAIDVTVLKKELESSLSLLKDV